MKYLADVPFTLNLGEPGKLGGYVEKQEDHKFPERMRMGMLLRDEKADFCLAYDLLAGVGGDTELIGLIIPNEKQCQMTITLVRSMFGLESVVTQKVPLVKQIQIFLLISFQKYISKNI